MTLHAAPGRLTKLTKSTITFKDGEQFRVWKGNGDQDVFSELVAEQATSVQLLDHVLSLLLMQATGEVLDRQSKEAIICGLK